MARSVMNSRSDFFLPASNKAEALASLKRLFGRAAADLETLQDALALGAFEITEDEEGNVDDLFLATSYFDPEDAEALKAIAPFVRSGSYVMFIEEDADQWAWVFRSSADTDVVEAFEERVIPLLETEYERLRAAAGEKPPSLSPEPSSCAGGCDDAECEGP